MSDISRRSGAPLGLSLSPLPPTTPRRHRRGDRQRPNRRTRHSRRRHPGRRQVAAAGDRCGPPRSRPAPSSASAGWSRATACACKRRRRSPIPSGVLHSVTRSRCARRATRPIRAVASPAMSPRTRPWPPPLICTYGSFAAIAPCSRWSTKYTISLPWPISTRWPLPKRSRSAKTMPVPGRAPSSPCWRAPRFACCSPAHRSGQMERVSSGCPTVAARRRARARSLSTRLAGR